LSITKKSRAKREIESGKRGAMFKWRGMKKVNKGGNERTKQNSWEGF
jgi:hypothetical protein